MSETDHLDQEHIKAIANEYQQIREAIAGITMGWAALESHMALLLDVITNKTGVGLAIYYAPANTETRFDIVDHALQTAIRGQKCTAIVMTVWAPLKRRLDSARKKRNKIFHGSIGTVSAPRRGGRGNYVRLMPPIFDFHRMQREHKDKQIPGMSAHDVSAITTRIWELGKDVNIMQDVMESLQRGDETTLKEKCSELIARHPN
ncbi:MAG: hypothetical protein HYW28_09340 [Rhodospirillales bacterium]|nr:hypothetical protein [Rhodospirillales bacterium]